MIPRLSPLLLLLACQQEPCDTWIWYHDGDQDGFGDASTTETGCESPAPDYWTSNDEDCDDTRADVHRGVRETCDGIDQDCDGLVDEAPADAVWYADADGDGHGRVIVPSTGCEAPPGAVSASGDCDDSRADVFPGGTEICDAFDNDCDARVDEADGYADLDGDGFGDSAAPMTVCDTSAWVLVSRDCDDARADVFPGAVETCDGVDEDCDGIVDDYGGGYHADADGDGFGGAGPASICAPSRATRDSSDCDDTNAGAFPGALEVCDHVDQDCDGYVDDNAADGEVWYEDCDGDGYGGSCTTRACFGEEPSWLCSETSWGYCTTYVKTAGDCKDSVPSEYPGSYESCDGYDENCNGIADDGAGWYYCKDADRDGYGDWSTVKKSCSAPAGYVSCDWVYDCDDTDVDVHPFATETCDGVDENCNGELEDDAAGATEWYVDADGDGYGQWYYTTWSCDGVPPAGFVSNSLDCNDSRSDVYPGASETCDDVDQDCDGTVDDEVTSPTDWYADADADGFGAGAVVASGCDGPTGAASNGSDCDDAAGTVFPGAPELCDGVANDCAASSWSDASEAGLAARENADGTWEDATAELAFGFHVSPPAGSTTWLCAGTYAGTFEITEDDVTIAGRQGAGDTTLVWTTSTGASAIAVTGASGASVRGLTLTSGTTSGALTYTVAGIDASYADDLLVEDCTISGLVAARATAAAQVAYAPATFRRVTFSDNLAWRDGTAGLNVVGADVVIEDCVFDGNRTSVDSGAALRLSGATATVSRSTFADNIAGDGGAAVHVQDSTLDLSACTLTRNTASLYGGAIAILGTSTVTCASSTFDGNSASEGGAIAFPSGSAGTFTATACDLGATTANSPDDVAIGTTWSWSAAGTSTFGCDATAITCGP